MSRRQSGGKIWEIPEEVLAVVTAGESSRTMLTPAGHGPPRIYGKELGKEVAALCFSEFESSKT